MATSITFRYHSGATTYSRTFTALAVRGLDEPDRVEFVPPLQVQAMDGGILGYIKGFRRIITVRIGVLQETADRAFMLNFVRSNDRWIYLGSLASVYCVLENPDEFENTWLYDTSLMRYFEIGLKETVTYQEWPELVEPTADTLSYIKWNVEITGTLASPQTLTTNAGALTLDETGNPYPAINLAAYVPMIKLTELQDCLIVQTANPTQSGTDITFQVAHSDIGNPYADGKFYADIEISLQAIPT